MFRVTAFYKFDSPVTDEWRIGTEFNGGIHGLIGAFSCNLSRENEGTTKTWVRNSGMRIEFKIDHHLLLYQSGR